MRITVRSAPGAHLLARLLSGLAFGSWHLLLNDRHSKGALCWKVEVAFESDDKAMIREFTDRSAPAMGL